MLWNNVPCLCKQSCLFQCEHHDIEICQNQAKASTVGLHEHGCLTWTAVNCGEKIAIQILRGTDPCRNVLYQTSLTIICLYLGEKSEKRKMTELENQRKQSVTRLHLNLPKLNGVMGGGRGAVIINTTHDKSVHRLWQAAQSHVQTSTEKTVLIRHLRAAGRSTQRKVGVFTGCRFSGKRKGFLHHLLSIG